MLAWTERLVEMASEVVDGEERLNNQTCHEVNKCQTYNKVSDWCPKGFKRISVDCHQEESIANHCDRGEE